MNLPTTVSLADRIGREKLDLIIHSFYQAAKISPVLGAAFVHANTDREHTSRQADFWWSALGGKSTKTVQFNMAKKHLDAGFSEHLLLAWKELFLTTLRQHLANNIADEWMTVIDFMGGKLMNFHTRHALDVNTQASDGS